MKLMILGKGINPVYPDDGGKQEFPDFDLLQLHVYDVEDIKNPI